MIYFKMHNDAKEKILFQNYKLNGIARRIKCN